MKSQQISHSYYPLIYTLGSVFTVFNSFYDSGSFLAEDGGLGFPHMLPSEQLQPLM